MNEQEEYRIDYYNSKVIADVFYHGTNYRSFRKILKSGFIATNYFDEEGIYLTDDIMTAKCFGYMVLVFKNLDVILEEDNANDGYFHRGKLPLELCTGIITDFKHPLAIKDVVHSILDNIEEEENGISWEDTHIIKEINLYHQNDGSTFIDWRVEKNTLTH